VAGSLAQKEIVLRRKTERENDARDTKQQRPRARARLRMRLAASIACACARLPLTPDLGVRLDGVRRNVGFC